MPSSDIFTTYNAAKQAEIIAKLMELFKCNERFQGAADVQGSKFEEDKNKWRPANIRMERIKPAEIHWRAHLSGTRFLGGSPLLDDGTVWFASLDIDKIGNGIGYDISYDTEMQKIKESGFPLVVFRTKSGGLRPTVFFSEPVEADVVVAKMAQMAASLGYGGCEIFPKQTSVNLDNKDKPDFPGWIFLPFGPMGGMFPEQCCMDDNGEAMDLYQAIVYAMRMRVTKEKFLSLFIAEQKAKANGRANGKKHPKGIWVQPADGETYDMTISTMFVDGPICLWHIAKQGSRDNQHYFLLNCALFLKRKYNENWDEALKWVNANALRPVGDPDKFLELVKDIKKREDHNGRAYEYTCKNEPICSHCHAKACRTQPYGVGTIDGEVDHGNWGMTYINCEPREFFISVNDKRIHLVADQLLNQQKFSEVCLGYGIPIPKRKNANEWIAVINRNMEEANVVEPTVVMRTHARELEFLEDWISRNILPMVRSKGEEFLNGGGNKDDAVRIQVAEKRFYLKWQPLQRWTHKSSGAQAAERLRRFLQNHCEYHGKDRGSGVRDWFRCTYSISFDQFDEDDVAYWLNPDRQEDDNVEQ